MSIFKLPKWESAEDFLPPKGSKKYIPNEMLNDFDYARARADNNALLALRLKPTPKPKTGRQFQAIPHIVARNLDYFHLPRHLRTYVEAPYRRIRKMVTTPTPFETLPTEILKMIYKPMCNADLVCLSLASKKTMRITLRTNAADSFGASQFSFVLITEGVWAYMELMTRLSSWMPPFLVFCHHCLSYLPASTFPPTTSTLGYHLVCNDCNVTARKVDIRPITDVNQVDLLQDLVEHEEYGYCQGCEVYKRVQEILPVEERYVRYGQKLLGEAVARCCCHEDE